MVLILFQASARVGSAAVELDFLAVLVGGFRRMLLGGVDETKLVGSAVQVRAVRAVRGGQRRFGPTVCRFGIRFAIFGGCSRGRMVRTP